METKMKTCFICHKKLKPSESSHTLMCAKNNNINLNKDELKFEQIKHQTTKLLLTYEIIYKLYVEENYIYSQFKNEFSITSKQLDFIIKHLNITKRNRDLSYSIRQNNYEKTVFDNYGVKSMNSLRFVQDKKEETFLRKYGVKNIFQIGRAHV